MPARAAAHAKSSEWDYDPDQWPPDYVAVYAWRQHELELMRRDAKYLYGALEYYRDPAHCVDFIEDWVDSYDPRNAFSDERPTNFPFILFGRQRELVAFFLECLGDQSPGLVEKARDMGATWVAVGVSVWLWLFRPGAAVGWGSRKEQLVDKLGDPSSIFEKIRMVLRHLPPEFMPQSLNWDLHVTYMKCVNPDNGATIIGEGGDNIGRGGRTLLYFKDEAQPLTANIMTPAGWRSMGSLAVGDEVTGPDGLSRAVTHINVAGEHPIYRMRFGDGTFADCSPNHKWAVDKVVGKRERVVLRAAEVADSLAYVSPGGQTIYRYRVPTTAPVQFAPRAPLPLHPYVVGALLGDGSIAGVPKGVVSFTSADPEIVAEVAANIPAGCSVSWGGGYHYRIVDSRGKTGHGVKSRARLAVVGAGIAGHGAAAKFVPDAYKFAAPAERLALLQGLMDTDGSASGGTVTFHSASRRLAEDVRFLVQSLGGTATLNVKPDHRGFLDINTLHVVMPPAQPPFRLPRKAILAAARKNRLCRTIVGVEVLPAAPVQCITVAAPDGLYLTDSFIVTHNSAHYMRPESIEASLGDNTRVQIDISSVNGMGNPFQRKARAAVEWRPGMPKPEGRKTRKFILDWSAHPDKTRAWYEERKAADEANGLAHIFAQEVDRDYAASVEGTIILPAWIEAAVGARAKLGLPEAGPWGAALDVADGGADTNAGVARRGISVKTVKGWGARDTAVTARNAVDLFAPHCPLEIQYDSIGVGSGVKAEVNSLADANKIPAGMKFVPWAASAAVQNPMGRVNPGDAQSMLNEDFFGNLKAQAWWELGRRFYRTWRWVVHGIACDPDSIISLDPDLPALDQLKQELAQAVFIKGASLKLIVDKTPEGTKSPNLADAVVMAFFPVLMEGQGLMDYYKALASAAGARKPATGALTPQNGGVRLYAPAGTSTVFTMDGTRVDVGLDRAVIVSSEDAPGLRAAGFTDNPGA